MTCEEQMFLEEEGPVQNEEEEESRNEEYNSVNSNWTKDDKFILLQAIKLYGSKDLDTILTLFPLKSKEELEALLNYYRSKIDADLISDKKKKRKKSASSHNLAPMSKWLQYLTRRVDYEGLCTEVASALRLIADHESFPDPEICEGINFATVYGVLANALDGKSLPIEGWTPPLMEKCLLEAALTSKGFIRKAIFNTLIDRMSVSENEINVFPRPTSNEELSVIRHLASQRSYNPFHIDEAYLKQTVFLEIEE